LTSVTLILTPIGINYSVYFPPPPPQDYKHVVTSFLPKPTDRTRKTKSHCCVDSNAWL